MYGVVAVLIWRWGGGLEWRPLDLSWEAYGLLPLRLLLIPALLEEAVFRGLLVPLPDESVSPPPWVWLGVSLLAYVFAHPLGALLFAPSRLPLSTDPLFLALVTLLGVACTFLYRLSSSLWPAVGLHWVTVVVWVVLLGGEYALRGA